MFLTLHEEEKQEETRKALVNGPRPWAAPNDWCAPELGSGFRCLAILWTEVPWRSPLPTFNYTRGLLPDGYAMMRVWLPDLK